MSLNRRRIAALVLLGAILLIAATMILSREPKEPEYQGRTLSSWLSEATSKQDEFRPHEEADAAVRQIGTNALPLLLRWSHYQPSAWRIRLSEVVRRSPPRIRHGWVGQYLNRDQAAERKSAASTGFNLLGPIAAPATPALYMSAIDAANEDQAKDASMLLAEIGSNAVPALLAVATNSPHRSARIQAVSSLGFIGQDARSAIPELMRWSHDPDEEFARNALCSLGIIHEDPDKVVPMLMSFLADPNAKNRGVACFALAQFSLDARPAIPLLISNLNDTNDAFATACALTLGSLQQEPGLVVRALRAVLQNDNLRGRHPSVRHYAAAALRGFGDQARPAAPELLRLLNDPDEGTRKAARLALSEIAPETLTNSVAQ